MKKLINNPSGFTLVELMITMVISGIIVAAIYSAYLAQQRSYQAQEQVAEMQQNIRAALMLMTREIRMAGYDPTSQAGAGITTASAGQISFTQDITDDGDTADPGEIFDYGFPVADDAARDGIPDTDNNPADGVPDALSLGRQTGGAGGYQPVAENIQAIEFCYDTVTTLANTPPSCTTAPADLNEIRSVQISILARAGQSDRKFKNGMIYTTTNGNNWGPYNDNFRRRLLITTVNCRNMGL